jgi:hypothetical protein
MDYETPQDGPSLIYACSHDVDTIADRQSRVVRFAGHIIE